MSGLPGGTASHGHDLAGVGGGGVRVCGRALTAKPIHKKALDECLGPFLAERGRPASSARRLVERGARFVQILHGSNGGAGAWDAHSDLKRGHSTLCARVDRAIAGLLKDVKRPGLLDETPVVQGTEFGRTPGAEGADGRDYLPHGFSVWLAGGGVKGGTVHGATDELGFHAVEHRHHVTDLHATVLHPLGLDPRRLEVPGRKRVAIDFGQPIHETLA